MVEKIIIIDGTITSYGYSKQFVRNELAGNSKNAVTVKISSLGGSVDEALSIYDQFIEHGNVTAELSAFVASAATLISLGAKTVRMNENSFYLIHKAMNWVDEWGAMNEDEIEALITKLEDTKQYLAKVTLQLAKMYVKKTGKTLDEITALMKQQTWLNAEEAKAWGFVDEVYVPAVAINYFENHQMVAMITSNGFPQLPRKTNPTILEIQNVNEDSFFEKIWNRIVNQQREVKIKNTVIMVKQFSHLNNVLSVEALESTNEGVFLNEGQLQSVEERLELNQQLVVERDGAISERDTATATLGTAQSEIATAQATIAKAYDPFNAIDPTVASAATPEAKAEAVRILLAARPAVAPIGNLGTKDEIVTDPEVDWVAINNLEHNKLVDANS